MMPQTFRRWIFIISCFVYATASVILGTQEASRSVAWALWAAAITHIAFGVDALLECFVSAHYANRIADLEAQVTALNAKIVALSDASHDEREDGYASGKKAQLSQIASAAQGVDNHVG